MLDDVSKTCEVQLLTLYKLWMSYIAVIFCFCSRGYRGGSPTAVQA